MVDVTTLLGITRLSYDFPIYKNIFQKVKTASFQSNSNSNLNFLLEILGYKSVFIYGIYCGTHRPSISINH